MRFKGWIYAAVLVVGGSMMAAAQQPEPNAVGGFTELQRGQVAGEDDLEVVMGLVEAAGESTSPKHYHPGGEYGFVLEGAATIITENQPPLTVEAGTSFYQPAGEWHIIKTGAGGTRAVVFRTIRKGEPVIVVVE